MSELPRVVTDRLVLRAFVASDGAAVERLAGAFEVADTTLNIPHPYPAGAGAEWIATHADDWQRRQQLTLAISHAAQADALIGAISLRVTPEHAHAEIGYWIAVDSWANGYATEAANAIVAFAFDELAMQRVQGRHFVRNGASGRVLEKLGMTHEGVHRQAFRRWDSFEDVAVYAVLRPDWKHATSRNATV